ncbi:acyl-CoA dehydrogenase [Hymenobacter sp. UV11]|uniref:acyl-CoA dehydrogenase family protein n=1 Tax=Hymenobacter sp. UV11 TaxID=1849735 RepID=UPI00106037CA|nr:acyl-CoA dehydrogenase family protein [Hymenobacter sp. UV11]TDN37430.1 acyl-CoA dehydrogenase [Hymenobacter sp. UV11]TFZ68619.1 acyl-CoA dehydrogenase [Hymenobacter sp. UV11]
MTEFTPATAPPIPPPLPDAAAPTPATPASVVVAAAQLAPRLLAQAAATDTIGGFPAQEMTWLREAGLLTAALSPSMGGAGLGEPAAALALLQALYHIGRGNLAVGRLWEGHVNALLLVRCFGTAAQIARAAADARAGHVFGVWNTENPAEGVHLEPLPAAPGHYRLRGAKTFASGSGHITRPVLTGMLVAPPAPAVRRDQGPSPLPVPAPTPLLTGWQLVLLRADEQPPVLDRSFWRPLGMRATASFRADFTGLEIGTEDLIGQPNDYYRAPWFGGGAARFAAVQLGGAAAVLDETRRFLRRLGRTDDPYQRQRLGEMLLLHEAGQRWLRGAAEHAALPPTPAEMPPPARLEALAAYVNALRTTTEDICLQTLRLAERSVGARGLLQPEPFERLHRDLTHYLRQPAPDAAQADIGRFALASDKPTYQLW